MKKQRKNNKNKLFGIRRVTALAYLSFLAVSVVLVVLFFVLDGESTGKIQDALLCLGTGLLSATMLAYFIELVNTHGKADFRRSIRTKSLSSLYFGLKSFLDRFVWLVDKFEDDGFDWDLSPEVYYTPEFASRWESASTDEFVGGGAETIIKEKVGYLSDKACDSSNGTARAKKLFLILSVCSSNIPSVIEELDKNQLFFEANKIITRLELSDYNFPLTNTMKDMEKADVQRKIEDVLSIFSVYKNLCEKEDFKFALSPDSFDLGTVR